MKTKKFQRKKEDFVCKQCGQKVIGGGYTDHCPVCLWSRHADINPGDRAAECKGMMRPVGVETKSGRTIINYQCEKCGFRHRVKAAPEDNFEQIIRIARDAAK